MHNPQEYLKNDEVQRKDAEITVKSWKPIIRWNSNDVILDIGCGPGDLTSSLLASYCPDDSKIIGSDLAEEMVNFAKKKYTNDRISFKVLDISSQNIWNEWEEKHFDKIFSFYCLQWVVDQRQAAINMNNLLKENGTVNLMFIDYHPVYAWYDITKSLPKWASYTKDFEMWEGYAKGNDFKKEYEHLLISCGFEIVSNNVREAIHEFDSIQECHDFLESVNAFKDKMTKKEVKEFVDDSLTGQLERGLLTKTSQGAVVQNYTLIEVIARKTQHVKQS